MSSQRRLVEGAPVIRVATCGSVHVVHQLAVPNFEQAKAECAAFRRLAEQWGSGSVFMMLDALLPLATPDVRAVYRHAVEYGLPTNAWCGVVGGTMGMAASIASRIAAQVLSRRPVPMRVFRTIPQGAAWLVATVETHTSVEALIATANELRRS